MSAGLGGRRVRSSIPVLRGETPARRMLPLPAVLAVFSPLVTVGACRLTPSEIGSEEIEQYPWSRRLALVAGLTPYRNAFHCSRVPGAFSMFDSGCRQLNE